MAASQNMLPLLQSPHAWLPHPALLRRPGLLLAGVFITLVLLASINPHLLIDIDPLATHAVEAFRAPSAAHWLGTDENGRDVLARLIYGARPSLMMGLAATAIGLAAGITLGLLAGLGPRWLDAATMRFVDVLLAFPELLLALVIITFWGQGLVNAMIAVGIAGIPRYARLVRVQTHRVRSAGYVEAAVTLGVSRPLLILRHVLPNAVQPVLILATISIGGNIAAGASLSFLGFGAPPPAPEWGAMLSVGRNFLSNAWWLVAVPGTAITLSVVSITVLGRAWLRYSEGKQS